MKLLKCNEKLLSKRNIEKEIHQKPLHAEMNQITELSKIVQEKEDNEKE